MKYSLVVAALLGIVSANDLQKHRETPEESRKVFDEHVK